MLYTKERRKLLGDLMRKKSETAEAGGGGRGTVRGNSHGVQHGAPRQPQGADMQGTPTGLDMSTWNAPSQSGRNLVSSLIVKATCVQCR